MTLGSAVNFSFLEKLTDFSIWSWYLKWSVTTFKKSSPQKISKQQYINKCGNSGGNQIFAFPINISEIDVYQVIQKWPFWDS